MLLVTRPTTEKILRIFIFRNKEAIGNVILKLVSRELRLFQKGQGTDLMLAQVSSLTSEQTIILISYSASLGVHFKN
jgi:hypothetical protein